MAVTALLITTCYLVLPKPDKSVKPATPPWLGDDQLQQAVVGQTDKSDAPGIIFTLYKGDSKDPEIVLEIGHADHHESRAISRNDHFRVASLSKSFVGYIMLRLVDEGRVNLDATLADYLPDAPNADKVILRDLGTNTSGVPNIARNQDFQRAVEQNPEKYWSASELLAFTDTMPAEFDAGAKWSYSNTNTIYLAQVIEKITGLKYGQALNRYVLEHLGLTHTDIDTVSGVPQPTPKGYRYGNTKYPFKYGGDWLELDHWNASWAGASGNLYSNEQDIAVFTHALLSGELLSKKQMGELFNWQKTTTKNLHYGFQVWDYFGARVMMGDVHGFSAFSAYLPEYDRTLVVLANLSNEKNKYSPAYLIGTHAIREIYALN